MSWVSKFNLSATTLHRISPEVKDRTSETLAWYLASLLRSAFPISSCSQASGRDLPSYFRSFVNTLKRTIAGKPKLRHRTGCASIENPSRGPRFAARTRWGFHRGRCKFPPVIGRKRARSLQASTTPAPDEAPIHARPRLARF